MSDLSARPIKEIKAELSRARYTVLKTVLDLGEALLFEWPVEEGDAYYEALQVCVEVLTNPDRPSGDARAAFVAAAREAGVSVLPDDQDDFLDRYHKALVN